MMMERRLHILMSAYACEPGKGSEPEVGWQWVTRMAKHHRVTVITRANNRPTIEQGLVREPAPHPKFIYYDPPRAILRLKRRGLPIWAFYLIWQWGALNAVREQLPRFDIVHHVTFNTFQLPGFWSFARRPLALGPLGGGMIAPPQLLSLFGARAITEAARSAMVWLSSFNPLVRHAFARAGLILAANEETELRVGAAHRPKVKRMLETGINVRREAPARSADPALVRVLWIGSFIPRKGGPLAVKALARAIEQCPALQMTFVGTGNDEERIRREAKAWGVLDRITFRGRVPYAEIPPVFDEHDIFLFTSLRDTSGNVVLEAMASGLPVVAIRHQGVAEMTSDETAIRVEPGTVSEVVEGLAGALVKLARSPELRKQLGLAGLQRVRAEFDWDRKVELVAQWYRDL